MVIDLEDVIKLLEELEHDKTKLALIPDANVYLQYAHLGHVDGIKTCIRKLKNHYEREFYS